MNATKSQFHICITSWEQLTFVLLAMSLWLPFSEPAVVALTQYTMDQRPDCVSAGFLDVPRGQTIKLNAPSKDASTSTQVLSCRLQFSTQTEGDTLRVTLSSGSSFGDCDVSLELQMTNSNSDKIIMGCKSGTGVVPALEAVNGKASIWLTRRQFEDSTYWFEVTVTAFRAEMQASDSTASTGDIGKIVGISVGVIGFVILIIIISVCCYLKRRDNDREGIKSEYNSGVMKNSPAVHGYENNMAKISYEDSFNKSQESDKKLLGQNYLRDDENIVKQKSALERFGHPHREQSNLESRAAAVRNRERYDESGFTRTSTNLENKEALKPIKISTPNVVEEADRLSQPISSHLAALHSNPKFRKSFHENEIDAEERVRRISDHSSSTNSADSDSKPKLPAGRKSPQRSPHLQRQGEKITGTFRARPSSSEIERFKDEESEYNDVKMHGINQALGSTDRGNEKSDNKFAKVKRNTKQNEETYEREKKENNRKEEKKLQRKHPSQDDEIKRKTEHIDNWQNRGKHTKSVDEDDMSQTTEREYEGRFKKSASGRKPKGKGPRMGRSKSAGNALEELDSSYQRARSKSSSSVRSLILAEDDDDDELDSNYTNFRRSGSKMSLYASRSSLYGRRRKNSMGETVSMSSYMHDDIDSRMGDFDKTRLSHKEKERLFKSTGDLDMSSASAVIFRECATQTGNNKEVYIYGRKTFTKNRPGKRYSHGTQTVSGNERRDSTGSSKSGKSARSNHLKSRSKSQESLKKQKIPRTRDYSEDDSISERSHRRRRSKRQDKYYSDDDDDDDRHSDSDQDSYYSNKKNKRSQNKSRETNRDFKGPKEKYKPNAMPRKFTNTSTNDVSDSDDDKSTVTTNTAPSYIQQSNQQLTNVAHFIPTGYPVAYPQPTVAYMSTAPGGPPLMFPVTSVPQSAIPQKPSLFPKPDVSKWDQLVNLTEGMKKRRHQMGESLDTESVLSSRWSQPVAYDSHPQVHYSLSPYTVAQRMPDSGSAYGSVYPESTDI